MALFLTRYELPGGRDARTQLYAESLGEALELVKDRKMGEMVVSQIDPRAGPVPEMASDLLRAGQIKRANHALVWTSMIAVRAGVADAWDLLCDTGQLHEMAHLVELGPSWGRNGLESLAVRIETLERVTPGHHPCWGGADFEQAERERLDLAYRAAETNRKVAQAEVMLAIAAMERPRLMAPFLRKFEATRLDNPAPDTDQVKFETVDLGKLPAGTTLTATYLTALYLERLRLRSMVTMPTITVSLLEGGV